MRSDVLRLLTPRVEHDERTALGVLKRLIDEAKQMECRNLAREFFSDAASLLKNPSSAEGHEQLSMILQEGAEVSTKLATQRSGLLVGGMEEGLVFDSTSRDMTAHTLHHADLDDDEGCLNGKPVLMVTHPLVLATGKSDGSDFAVNRVLKKRVVWMGKN